DGAAGVDQLAVDLAGQRGLGQARADGSRHVLHRDGVVEGLLAAVGERDFDHGVLFIPAVLPDGKDQPAIHGGLSKKPNTKKGARRPRIRVANAWSQREQWVVSMSHTRPAVACGPPLADRMNTAKLAGARRRVNANR